MNDERLDGLCMIIVYRETNGNKQTEFIDNVINEFGFKKRNRKFIFSYY